MAKPKSGIQARYDRIAEHYAAEYLEELKSRSFDCEQAAGKYAETKIDQ